MLLNTDKRSCIMPSAAGALKVCGYPYVVIFHNSFYYTLFCIHTSNYNLISLSQETYSSDPPFHLPVKKVCRCFLLRDRLFSVYLYIFLLIHIAGRSMAACHSRPGMLSCLYCFKAFLKYSSKSVNLCIDICIELLYRIKCKDLVEECIIVFDDSHCV